MVILYFYLGSLLLVSLLFVADYHVRKLSDQSRLRQWWERHITSFTGLDE